MGIIVVDAKETVAFHLPGSKPISKATSVEFAGALVSDILDTKYASFSMDTDPGRALLPLLIEIQSDAMGETTTTPLSALTDDTPEYRGIVVPVPLKSGAPEIPEYYRARHQMCQTSELITNSKRLNRKRCKGCSSKTAFKCHQCGGKFYCQDGTGVKARRYCFYKHVCDHFLTSGLAGQQWKDDYDEWLSKLNLQIYTYPMHITEYLKQRVVITIMLVYEEGLFVVPLL